MEWWRLQHLSCQGQTFGQMGELRLPSVHYGLSIEGPELIFTANKKWVNGDHSCPSLIKVLSSCPKDIFPNINWLLQALITVLITSCTVERLFSTVNKIKTSNRATMLTCQLNSLSFLWFEKEWMKLFHCSRPSLVLWWCGMYLTCSYSLLTLICTYVVFVYIVLFRGNWGPAGVAFFLGWWIMNVMMAYKW